MRDEREFVEIVLKAKDPVYSVAGKTSVSLPLSVSTIKLAAAIFNHAAPMWKLRKRSPVAVPDGVMQAKLEQWLAADVGAVSCSEQLITRWESDIEPKVCAIDLGGARSCGSKFPSRRKSRLIPGITDPPYGLVLLYKSNTRG